MIMVSSILSVLAFNFVNACTYHLLGDFLLTSLMIQKQVSAWIGSHVRATEFLILKGQRIVFFKNFRFILGRG